MVGDTCNTTIAATSGGPKDPQKLTTLNEQQKRELYLYKQKHPRAMYCKCFDWVFKKFKAKVHKITIGRVLKQPWKHLLNVIGNSVKRNRHCLNPLLEEGGAVQGKAENFRQSSN